MSKRIKKGGNEMLLKGRTLLVLVVSALLVVLAGCSNDSVNVSASKDGADYPKRPITLIIPYAAGGSADIQARLIGESLQKQLGQAVNVVSRAGGAGATGMNAVKSSKADGYTIILTAVGPSTLTPNANQVGYNVTEDFFPIAQVSEAPYGLAVNGESTIQSLDKLLDYAGKNAGKATFGTTGAGLHQHIVMSDFLNQIQGADMEHIPFEGGAEAVSALLGNHVTATMNTISEIIPHEESGGLKIVAVTSDERLKDLPDVPTFKELGYQLVGQGAWFGIMAPKDTPEEIVNILDASIKKALEDEAVKKQFDNAGLPIQYLDSAQFTEKVKEENEKNAKVIQALNQK
ncbi:tripartite tricarboxylate transporter substrate binding protein [Sporosarcina sp. NPDC096371]|uniref:tripartite tricarboxylate transporter substrate binding protein n=1 Tax=Sporosarcina sp. NPDC096371 TaxID=3364530 RepID=UPI0037F754E5